MLMLLVNRDADWTISFCLGTFAMTVAQKNSSQINNFNAKGSKLCDPLNDFLPDCLSRFMETRGKTHSFAETLYRDHRTALT